MLKGEEYQVSVNVANGEVFYFEQCHLKTEGDIQRLAVLSQPLCST